MIMADVVLADGTEKTVAINPADGKVMKVAMDQSDRQDDEKYRENGGDEAGESVEN